MVEEEFVSHLRAPAPSRPWSSTLPERRTMMRLFTERNNLKAPDVKSLTRHAERFGSGLVVETAAELGYGFDELVRLTDACDRIDAKRAREEHPHRKRSKLKASEDRVKELLGTKKENDGTEVEKAGGETGESAEVV